MKIEDNKLYSIVSAKRELFRKEAKSHKVLHRTTWWSTTFISLAIAFASNFEFAVLDLFNSSQIAGVLGIILPAVTAYIVLRSPERLWIFEISIRNRLSDLEDRIVLAYERDPKFDSTSLENEYLKVLQEANERWVDIKQAGN